MGHKCDTQHTVPLCVHLKRGALGGQRHSGQKVFLQGIDGRWACHALHSAQGPGTVPALALHIGIQQGRCLAPASLLGTEETGKVWHWMFHVTGPGRWGCCPQGSSMWILWQGRTCLMLGQNTLGLPRRALACQLALKTR